MSFDLNAIDILEKLIAFPTVSSDSNLALIDWVEAYLAHHGVTATRVYDDTGKKANLFANVGPAVDGGVILSGHTDVVPVEGQDWGTDPWALTEKGGRLYGRGTCDMKGFDALALAAVPLALKRGVKRPLQIAMSYDEEVGCLGAPRMIDAMAATLPRARAAIIGEPSGMKAVTAHKGAVSWRTHVRGHEVHSSLLHQGVSAVMEAAKLIHWAGEVNADSAAQPPDALAALFTPAWSSLHVGRITGGTADNITARDCRFAMTLRLLPGQDLAAWKARYLEKVAEVEAQMQAVHPDTRITVEEGTPVPGLAPEPNGVAEALVRQITGDNGTHVVSYGTEAGQFQERGYSAVICGPGDIAQAHQPNEYLERSQFEAGWRFMQDLVEDLCR